MRGSVKEDALSGTPTHEQLARKLGRLTPDVTIRREHLRLAR
jgi:hypothetical protein